MKRAVAFLLLLPALAFGQDLPAKYLAAIPSASGQGGLLCGLAFHAPFTDPANPLTIYKGTGPLTFTRAHDATHTATFVHPATGLVTVADNNQLRIEAAGALIEGARTNDLLWSQQMDNAVWSGVQGGTGSLPVVTSGYISPAGDNTAFRVVMDKGAGATSGDYCMFGQATGNIYLSPHNQTSSIYLRTTDGSTKLVPVRSVGGTPVVFTVTGQWQRCSVHDSITATSGSLQIAMRGTYGGSDNADLLVWGAQLEPDATTVSSYIPTGATAMTRNADALTFDPVGNISDSVGSLSLTFDTLVNGADYPRLLSAYGGEGGGVLLSVHNTSAKLVTYDQTAFRSSDVVYAWGATSKAGMSWTGTALNWTLDGTLSTPGVFDGTIGIGTVIRIGNDAVPGVPQQMFGHAKDLRIWNRALTNAELQAVTR